MDKREQAIEDTITQWTKLAETGEGKPELGIYNNCYLCQFDEDEKEKKHSDSCDCCPYKKKYGYCAYSGQPFRKWQRAKDAHNPVKCRIYAKAFCEQVKTLLRSPKMDKKQELEHKIDGAKKALVRLENRTEQSVKSIRANIRLLEKQLAEAEKPVKLRHGDCGIAEAGGMYFVNDAHPCNNSADRPFGIGTSGGGQQGIDHKSHSFKTYFNAFADLKTISKPFKGWKRTKGNNSFKVVISGRFIDFYTDKYCAFDIDEVKDLSLALRQAIHELEAKSK